MRSVSLSTETSLRNVDTLSRDTETVDKMSCHSDIGEVLYHREISVCPSHTSSPLCIRRKGFTVTESIEGSRIYSRIVVLSKLLQVMRGFGGPRVPTGVRLCRMKFGKQNDEGS